MQPLNIATLLCAIAGFAVCAYGAFRILRSQAHLIFDVPQRPAQLDAMALCAAAGWVMFLQSHIFAVAGQ